MSSDSRTARSLLMGGLNDQATQLEAIARNEYRAKPDEPDPTSCSLFYFALRKKRLVQGLWRQATFHKERNVMLKFLLNDFTEPRWKSAALKNAYALMSKQRFSELLLLVFLGLQDAQLIRGGVTQVTLPRSSSWETA